MSESTRPAGVLRTSDECFSALVDYPFDPHYVMLDHAGQALRMHFVDEGPRDAAPVLLLHGCPAWSYLYRKVIPPLVEAGHRVIAPDHIGCGRSDKLARREDYSYQLFVDCLEAFIQALDLKRLTLVAQDWGGPIGLRVLSQQAARFERVLLSNTLLPNCQPPPAGIEAWPSETIRAWIEFTANTDDMPVGQIIQGSTVSTLTDDVIAGFDAPFPDAGFKSAVLQWPSLIPVTAAMRGIDENRKVWRFLETFDKPFLTAYSDSDPTTVDWEVVFQRRVPGAKGLLHPKVEAAGHMVQEDQGEALAIIIRDFIAESPSIFAGVS